MIDSFTLEIKGLFIGVIVSSCIFFVAIILALIGTAKVMTLNVCSLLTFLSLIVTYHDNLHLTMSYIILG